MLTIECRYCSSLMHLLKNVTWLYIVRKLSNGSFPISKRYQSASENNITEQVSQFKYLGIYFTSYASLKETEVCQHFLKEKVLGQQGKSIELQAVYQKKIGKTCLRIAATERIYKWVIIPISTYKWKPDQTQWNKILLGKYMK